MPFNGSGVFQPIAAPDYPAIPGTTIKARQYNNLYNDVAAGLSNCLTLDGQSTVVANIDLNGHRMTGLAPAVDPADAVRLDQLATSTVTEGDWTDVVAGTTGKVLGTKFAGAGRLRPMGGLFPEKSNPAAMSIHIDPGYYVSLNGVLTLKAQGTRVIAAADATNDRYDVVYLNLNTGAFGVEAGEPAAVPVVPPIPGFHIPIAIVSVQATVTTILQEDITDVRGIVVANTEPTGSIKDFYRRTAPAGWVPLEGGTIGDATSGGTARANRDCYNLFVTMWDAHDASGNLVVQDSGGGASTPGANADADWGDHKRLVPVDTRGYARRAWDHGRGIDTARQFLSVQADAAADHRHRGGVADDAAGDAFIYGSTTTGVPGGATVQMVTSAAVPAQQGMTSVATDPGTPWANLTNVADETRVKNIAFLTCVKL